MNTLSNRPVIVFANKIISKLKEKPLHTYTEEEISTAKFGEEVCALCQQKGSDTKFAGKYAHNECLRYLNKELKKEKLKFR